MNNSKVMSRKKKIIIAAFIGLIGIILISIIEDNYLEKLKNEYSNDIRDESNINAKVINIIPWHGITNIHLSNNKKYWIDNSRNYNYDNIFIDDNIIVGDSIIKNDDSDSLWIKSSKGEFVFVVGKWINKPEK